MGSNTYELFQAEILADEWFDTPGDRFLWHFVRSPVFFRFAAIFEAFLWNCFLIRN